MMNQAVANYQIHKESPAAFASKVVNQTDRHLFLTGKAGTGKTTFLRYIINHTHKKSIIVAPTGIAAINAGGCAERNHSSSYVSAASWRFDPAGSRCEGSGGMREADRALPIDLEMRLFALLPIGLARFFAGCAFPRL